MSDLPRTTDVIKWVPGLMPVEFYRQSDPDGNSLTKGTAVDFGCRLLFEGYKVKDLERIDGIEGYLVSLELWIQHTGFKAPRENIQAELVDSVLGFYGHPDVFNKELVPDTKTGAPAKWHKLQSASYQHLTKSKRRGSLYLDEGGKIAKLELHEDSSDWAAFHSALKLLQGERAMDVYRQNLKNWVEAG